MRNFTGRLSYGSLPGQDKARTFETGATRDTDEGKPVFGKFLSSRVLRAFGRYMHKNRIQSDGKLRDGDNWQKGMEPDVYFESKFRHDFDLWDLHRGIPVFDKKGQPVTVEDACCAILFNVQGYLHEWLKDQDEVAAAMEDWAEVPEETGECDLPECSCYFIDVAGTPAGPCEYEPETGW
jgi:hypothetical protein